MGMAKKAVDVFLTFLEHSRSAIIDAGDLSSMHEAVLRLEKP